MPGFDRLLTAAVAAALWAPALAAVGDDRRSHLLQTGWFHIDTLDRTEPLRTQLRPSIPGTLLGLEQDFVSPGTGATISSSDTLALTYSYFIGDHFSIKLEGGVPVDFDLYGYGTVEAAGVPNPPAVDLAAEENNPLASATQWSPVLMLQYFFRDPQREIRPYLGLGVAYTWFTDVELDPQFEAALNEQFGATLAQLGGFTGDTYVEADATSDVAPIFNAGVSVDLSERWNLSLSASYSLLETETTIDIHAQDGTRLSRSTTTAEINPLVTAVLLGYRF